jgi:hypothetical protein
MNKKFLLVLAIVIVIIVTLYFVLDNYIGDVFSIHNWSFFSLMV